MADAVQAVPDETAEYLLTEFRGIPDPRRRLAGYCNPALLELWDAVLEPFVNAGFRLKPELGDSANLLEQGLEWGAPQSRLELRFSNRSRVFMPGLGRRSLPLLSGDWMMTLLVSLAETSGYVHDAYVRPVHPQTDADEITGETSLAPVNPFSLLAATPTAAWPESSPPVYLLMAP
jgi:hypothetical protein